MILYKILDHDGSARLGIGKWHLPKGKRPGKWMAPIKGDLVACENGYHLCRESDLLDWLGPAIFEAEFRGEIIEANDKIVVREARLLRKCGSWNETTARLFAADCAERVLPIFEKECPSDDRPRKAIEAARSFARGEIDDAARDAAKAAAWAVAKGAAWAAAKDAAWAAARAAARDAEQKWQQKQVLAYIRGNLG